MSSPVNINVKQALSNKDHWILVGFILAAILIRLPSFFPVSIDHDETTYLIIAQQWLEGQVPYVDTLDIKPIGIYALFTGLLTVFGQSVLVVRVAASVAIGLSAYFLLLAHRTVFSSQRAALFTGLIFIGCASVHQWSWSANTEIFALPFTLVVLYGLVRSTRMVSFLVIGLMAGLGFLIRYHMLFDLVAFAIFFLLYRSFPFRKTIAAGVLSMFGFLMPVGLVHYLYFQAGYWQEFTHAMYVLPGNYVGQFSAGKGLAFVGEFYLSYLPVSVVFLILLWDAIRGFIRKKALRIFLISWVLFVWIGVFLTGQFHFHYNMQAVAPLCFFLVLFFTGPHIPAWRNRFGQWLYKYHKIILVSFAVAILVNQVISLYPRKSTAQEIARDLAPKLKEGDQIFTNWKNVLYFLTKTRPPTRYVHTTILTDPELAEAYGIDRSVELSGIFKKKPVYCIIHEKDHDLLLPYLSNDYLKVRTYSKQVTLWKKRDVG